MKFFLGVNSFLLLLEFYLVMFCSNKRSPKEIIGDSWSCWYEADAEEDPCFGIAETFASREFYSLTFFMLRNNLAYMELDSFLLHPGLSLISKLIIEWLRSSMVFNNSIPISSIRFPLKFKERNHRSLERKYIKS